MAGEVRPNDSWTSASLPHMRTSFDSDVEGLRFASHRGAPSQDCASADFSPASGSDESFHCRDDQLSQSSRTMLNLGHGSGLGLENLKGCN
ncbi:hypothetical protein BDZ89DRAFT_189111 [Hymenopellis radicata]|nr:hypothetical protein BDZ89DRAFT_189111 [Hymenopellis radicata]